LKAAQIVSPHPRQNRLARVGRLQRRAEDAQCMTPQLAF
jgi:hypothetical protein